MIIFIVFATASCEQEVVTQDDLRSEVDKTTDILQFTILGGNYTPNSTTTLRVLGMVVGERIKIYNDIYCGNELADTTSTKGVMDIGLSFTSEDTYTLYYRYTDSTNKQGSCNSTGQTYTYDATAPTAPSIVRTTNPTSNISTPTFLITSYAENDIIKIFSDNECKVERLEVQGDSGSSMLKSITTPLQAEETYDFYYSIKDLAGNELEVSSSTCLSIAASTYVYDITNPGEANNVTFNTVSTISPKILRNLNQDNISSIQIYSDSTCVTKLCDSSNTDQFGVCIDNETNENYQMDDFNYQEFILSNTSSEIQNFYFKYKDSSLSESDCLRVNNYLVGNTAGNTEPLFTINDQALDSEATFDLTFTGVSEFDEITVYASENCVSSLGSGSVAASTSSANVNIGLMISNTYDFYYKLKDAAGNYAEINSEAADPTCISAELTYLFDNGNPSDHEQKMISPFHSQTSDNNVEVIDINGNIGDIRFLNLDGYQTLTIYNGENCTGDPISTEVISGAKHTAQINFNIIDNTNPVISYKKDSDACQNFSFLPRKMDGVDSKVILSLTGLQLDTTLYVYPDTSCTSGDEIHTETVTSEDQNITFTLTEAKTYNFSTKQIDEAGNESSCITVDQESNNLEYTYFKINDFTVGEKHSCITVVDPDDNSLGKLYCWGDNSKSQLGGITNQSYSTLPKLVSSSLSALKIESNMNTSCLLGGATGTDMYCFGENTLPYFDNLAIDSADADYEVISTEPGKETVIEVTGHSGASEIYFYKGMDCRGNPITTADVTTDPEQYTVNTKNQTNNIVSIATDDGTISCDNFQFTKVPIEVDSPGDEYEELSIGKSHICAINDSGNINCWGDHTYGQVGDGSAAGGDIDPFTATTGAATTYTQLSAGSYHTCGVDADENITCWGQGTSGQLGNSADSNTNSIGTPLSVTDADGNTVKFSKVESGVNFSCALSTSGTIWCWGANDINQLAGAKESNGAISSGTNKPLLIDSSDTFTELSISDNNGCAINSNSQLYCWGSGYTGIEQVTDAYKFSKVEVGINHSCALTTAGTLMCWGSNDSGQLGDGTTTPNSQPQEVIFDFNKTQLIVENTIGVEITKTIDLKYDPSTNQDKTLTFDNDEQAYGYWDGGTFETEVYYNLTVTNTSLTEATLDTDSVSITATEDEDYSDYFEISSTDCDTPLAAGNSCDIEILFTASISRPEGMSVILNLNYRDTDFSYNNEITVTGYSKRLFGGITILNSDEEDLQGGLVFNDDTEQFIASTFNKAFTIDEDGVVTIENPFGYPMYLKNFTITGKDKDGFSFATDVSKIDPDNSTCGEGFLEEYGTCEITLNMPDPEIECDEWGDCYEVEAEYEASVNADMFFRKDIFIENTSENDLIFNSVAITGVDGDQFQLFDNFTGAEDEILGNGKFCASTLAPDEACKVSVYFKPVKDDELDSTLGFDASLKISVLKDNEFNFVIIPLEAYADVYSPELAMSDSEDNDITAGTFEFNDASTANVANSDTTKAIIKISNYGDSDDESQTYSDAKNMTITLGGDDSTMFDYTGGSFPGEKGTCGTTLAVGESCEIELEYVPTSTTSVHGGGVHIGTVTVDFENANHEDDLDPIETEIKGYVFF